MVVAFGSPCRKPEPAQFTKQQREDVERLWKTQTNDTQDGRIAPDQIKPINTDCLKYMTRLHAFAFAFLKKHTADQSQCQDKNGGDDFLKDNLRESCLEPFYSRFVEKDENQTANNVGTIRLNGQKSVIMLHYEDFLFEVNQYEFRGKFRSDDEICAKHCFGAYLYHHPLDALPALNVALALAVMSLWRLRNNMFSEGAATTRNTNETSKADRFLDCCRINVRFVHVQPHLPMADIKTGILKKFITVKGHVVKARPRRLRVSTADL
jgi:hypothetical protein